MATTTTTLVPDVVELPYIRGGDEAEVWRSNAPRGEKFFTVAPSSTNITIAAAGEDQLITMQMILPSGFAYVLVELHATMFGADIGDWDTSARCEYKNNLTTNSATILAGMKCTSDGLWHAATTLPGTDMTVSAGDLYKGIMLPMLETDAAITFQWFNTTIDGIAMTFRMFARVLVYDINQAHHQAVNAPVPVR